MNTLIVAAGVVFICKALDCAFNTAKSIYMQKNKYVLSSTLNTISTLFYTVAIVKTANAGDNPWTLVAICVATFFGSLIPALMIERFEPDRLFIYEITSSTMESGQEFADILRDSNVPIRTSKTYADDKNKVLAIKAYSQSKATSRMIEDSLPERFKWIVYSPEAY